MPKKRKYDTEFLFQLIEEYLIDKSDYQTIIYAALVDYCQEKYPQMRNNITYQDFSRNKEIKAYIEDYNNRIEQRLLDINAVDTVAQNRLLDARKFYGLSEAETNSVIAKSNKYLANVYDNNRRVNESLCSKKREITALKKQNQEFFDAIEKAKADMVKLRTELASVRKENATIKHKNAELMAYIRNNIYDPVILNHFVEIGLLLPLDNADNTNNGRSALEECTLETIVTKEVLTKSESKVLAALTELGEE